MRQIEIVLESGHCRGTVEESLTQFFRHAFWRRSLVQLMFANARTGGRMDPTPKDFVTLRPWREIAAELAREDSTERVLKLSKELEEAFKAEEKKKAS